MAKKAHINNINNSKNSESNNNIKKLIKIYQQNIKNFIKQIFKIFTIILNKNILIDLIDKQKNIMIFAMNCGRTVIYADYVICF